MNILEQPSVQPDALFGVPYVYKLLGETDDGIKTLRKFKLCLFGGSAMPTELGDRLVDAGVKLAGHYVRPPSASTSSPSQLALTLTICRALPRSASS